MLSMLTQNGRPCTLLRCAVLALRGHGCHGILRRPMAGEECSLSDAASWASLASSQRAHMTSGGGQNCTYPARLFIRHAIPTAPFPVVDFDLGLINLPEGAEHENGTHATTLFSGAMDVIVRTFHMAVSYATSLSSCTIDVTVRTFDKTVPWPSSSRVSWT